MTLNFGRIGGTATVRIDEQVCTNCGLCVKVCKDVPLYMAVLPMQTRRIHSLQQPVRCCPGKLWGWVVACLVSPDRFCNTTESCEPSTAFRPRPKRGSPSSLDTPPCDFNTQLSEDSPRLNIADRKRRTAYACIP
jgi:ferredoxin